MKEHDKSLFVFLMEERFLNSICCLDVLSFDPGNEYVSFLLFYLLKKFIKREDIYINNISINQVELISHIIISLIFKKLTYLYPSIHPLFSSPTISY